MADYADFRGSISEPLFQIRLISQIRVQKNRGK
jgi:hypothetical protein